MLSVVASKRFLVAHFTKIFQITIIVPASFMLLTTGSILVVDRVDPESAGAGATVDIAAPQKCSNINLSNVGNDRNHELKEDHTHTYEGSSM